MGQMVEQPNQSQRNLVSDHHGHPVNAVVRAESVATGKITAREYRVEK